MEKPLISTRNYTPHLDAVRYYSIVNATSTTHGPSWRMVVELGPELTAWGLVPGGQSGNPGSKHYDDQLDTWAEGKYFKLHFLSPDESPGSEIELQEELTPAGK